MAAYTPEDVDRLLCQAINTGDLEAALGLYEPEAHFVVGPGQVVAGQEAIRQVLQQFLALQPTLIIEKIAAVQSGDIALLSSTWSLTGTGPDGSPVSLAGRGRVVVRRQPDGTWRFVIDDPNSLD